MKNRLFVCIVCVLFLLSGCESNSLVLNEGKFKSYFSDIFDVERVKKVKASNNKWYYCEMLADEIPFYVYSTEAFYRGDDIPPEECDGMEGCYHLDPGFTFCTSIVSSMYDKNKKEIESLANTYHLDLKYEEINFCTLSDWDIATDESTEIELMINNVVVNADISQVEDIRKFAKEVVKIDDIQKLYDLAYNKEDMELYDKLMVYDFSKINVYDGDTLISTFSIFDEVKENKIKEL